MTLLELLVKELPGRGGWPSLADNCQTYSNDKRAAFFFDKAGFKVPVGFIISMKDIDTSNSSTRVTREQYEAAQQPVWDGEGLPPVGSLVELMDDSQSQTWGDVTIKFYGDSFAVWDDHGEECSNSLSHVKVRTIRTEEDDIKREEAINAISLAYDTQDRFGNYRAATGVYEDIAAGKIPGVELSK